jgi:hypothetical protein
LSLSLTMGNRAFVRRETFAMAEADNPFQALAAKIQSKIDDDKRESLDCMSIMNSAVRPAMKDARAIIPQHPRIIWKDGEHPSIIVSGKYKNDLSYACNGLILEVTKTQGGGNTSHSEPIERVSKELIVKEIEDFLKEALEIQD